MKRTSLLYLSVLFTLGYGSQKKETPSFPLSCRPPYAFPVIALAGLLGVALCKAPDAMILAWLSSCAYMIGLATTAGFVTGVGLAGWISGTILVAGCMVYSGSQFAGTETAGRPRLTQF
jgi:hypothetical protein